MELGFWGNYERGDWFEIDEHEMLLPFAWKHAPIMRWRCHGASVTIEFNSENWQQPLSLIGQWGEIVRWTVSSFQDGEFSRSGNKRNIMTKL